MKKFSPFIILLLLSVNLIYSQKYLDSKEKTEKNFAIKEAIKAKNQKIYTSNWKKVETVNKSSWASATKPKKKTATKVNSSKSTKSKTSSSHARPKKSKKSSYPNTFKNSASKKDGNIIKSGSLNKKRTSISVPKRKKTTKRRLLPGRKNNK